MKASSKTLGIGLSPTLSTWDDDVVDRKTFSNTRSNELSPKRFNRRDTVRIIRHGNRRGFIAEIVDASIDDLWYFVKYDSDGHKPDEPVHQKFFELVSKHATIEATFPPLTDDKTTTADSSPIAPQTAPDQEESTASTAVLHPRSATAVAYVSTSTQRDTAGTLGK